MKLSWDDAKNEANIKKHGFDFADAKEVFEGLMLVRLDTRFEYGEERWIGMGTIQGRVVVVAYTEWDEGETLRIISVRKALKNERKRFEEEIANRLESC